MSVGCGHMGATGDLREDSSCGRWELSASNPQGPSPVLGPPPTGRSQAEMAVSAKEQNPRVDNSRVSVHEGKKRGKAT